MVAALFVLFGCSTPAPGGVRHVDARGAAEMIRTGGEILIVDVRTPGEFQAGHLENAVNVDFRGADFAGGLAKLPHDRPVLVHCQSGGRSTSSLPAFEAAGFHDITHMDGGFGSWQSAGLPVVR